MNKIIYLDAAASAQKPTAVIDAEMAFLRDGYANAGRGICGRAADVDKMVERTRAHVADFIGAASRQIVFTSGTTDGMNRIAHILHAAGVRRVAVSDLDHHSARLPFAAGGFDVVVMPMDPDFNLVPKNVPDADAIVITAMSNVLGMPQDVAAIMDAARAKNPNVITIVDAAQYVAHAPIDVRKWDCDFMCFSGHKIGADTGLGVMYMKNPDAFYPDRFGGGMVARVPAAGDIVLQPAPDRWEAGTIPLTQIAGLGPAIDAWRQWDGGADVREFMYDALAKIPQVRILTPRDAAMISFVIDNMHVLDFGARVGLRGLCVRVGNCCASWINRALGVDGVIRISNGPWNTMDDAVAAIDIIRGVIK